MRLRTHLLCGVTFGLAAMFSGAQAQTTPAAPAASAPETIETVLVTARKRSESSQKAPVAVTAVDANMIAKLFVRDLSDLDHSAPNFTIEGVGAIHRNAAAIFARGIGYGGVDMGQDPAVGVSVNGVFYSRNIGMLSNMEDVDHVEILRGPQGTLFGKNTVGGVVNITSKKPGDTLDFEVSGRVGNFGRADYFAAADVPIDDTFAVRVSYQSQYSTGPFQNVYNGQQVQLLPGPGENVHTPSNAHLGGDNVKTIRSTFVWNPISNFEADFVATYLKDRSESVGGQNGSMPAGLVNGGKSPADVLYLIGYPGYDFRTPGQPYPLGPNPPYVTRRDFPSGDFQDTMSYSLNTRYHAEDFDVVTVTGFIHDSNLSFSDYDNTELNFFESTFGLHSDQFSQEARLESTGDSPLKWVIGGLYTGRSWDGTQLFYSEFPSLNNHIDYSSQTDDSWAGFGQVDYAITPQLELTGGLRYTAESRNIFRLPSTLATDPTPPFQYAQKAWSNLSYKVGADYHIDDDKMAYISYSTGFVAGGFNSRVDYYDLTSRPYAPEKATALEVGLKSDWYDHRLRVNLAAFTNKYSGLQVGAFIPGGSFQQIIVNNAYERANGAELEASAIPIDHLTLSTSIGYLDAHYTSFFADVFGTGPADYSYLKIARAPQWTTRFEATYEIDLGSYGKLTPDASYEYESSHYTDLTNNPVGFQKGYGMWNANISYVEPEGRWKVALWGKNLNNALHILSAVPSSGYFTQLYFAQPMTYGIDLTIKVDGSTFK